MSWGKLLQPDLILGESVLAITPEVIHQHQLKGLVLDVDETLVPIHETDTSADVQQWLTQLKPLVPLWLVSNNLNANRIGRIAKTLDVPYVTGARKPSRRKLRRATQAMALPVEHIAMVGDRLFTDVLAGNRLGMFTIWVEPMVNPSGIAGQHCVRTAEVWVSQKLGVSMQANRLQK